MDFKEQFEMYETIKKEHKAKKMKKKKELYEEYYEDITDFTKYLYNNIRRELTENNDLKKQLLETENLILEFEEESIAKGLITTYIIRVHSKKIIERKRRFFTAKIPEYIILFKRTVDCLYTDARMEYAEEHDYLAPANMLIRLSFHKDYVNLNKTEQEYYMGLISSEVNKILQKKINKMKDEN